MFLLRALLFLFFLPHSVVQGQELLLLTFATGQPNTNKVYSTTSELTFSVADGQQVILQKSEGRDYRLSASPYGWSWTQVQQVARDATFIMVTPRRQGKKVSLEVNYSLKKGDDSLAYKSTVTGNIGQWIPLLQSASSTQASGVKRYTSGGEAKQLSVRVETAS